MKLTYFKIISISDPFNWIKAFLAREGYEPGSENDTSESDFSDADLEVSSEIRANHNESVKRKSKKSLFCKKRSRRDALLNAQQRRIMRRYDND